MNTRQTASSARTFWIELSFVLSLLTLSIFCFDVDSGLAVGIAPEQIYQENLDLASILGTWEKLPEINPLAEKSEGKTNPEFRTLLTLRKDGTCRVFDGENVSGADGTWKHDNHNVIIMLSGAIKLTFYVYGIKGDFMVTRSPLGNGVDQLWSRVK